MNRIKIIIDESTKKSTKDLLFERMGIIGGMPLTENNVVDIMQSKKKLDEKLDILEKFSLNEDFKGGEPTSFEDEFGDAHGNCLNPQALVDWLNDEVGRLAKNKMIRDKEIEGEPVLGKPDKDVDKLNPQVDDLKLGGGERQKNILDDKGKADIDLFIKNITRQPSRIIAKNPKMKKSGKTRGKVVADTGLPALTAIVYDIKTKQFFLISTCPGAGACRVGCYARKSFYELSNDKVMLYTRRINLLMNDPVRYEEIIIKELLSEIKRYDVAKIGEEGNQLVVRWNDAGDFFAQKYFDIAKSVTKKLRDMGWDVSSYAYSKRSKYVIDGDQTDHFTMNFSADADKEEVNAIENYENYENIKIGVRFFKKNFEGIFKTKADKNAGEIKSGEYVVKGKMGVNKKGEPAFIVDEEKPLPIFADDKAPDRLKDKVFNIHRRKYQFDRDSLKFTWELPLEELEENYRKFNVIVMPKGDIDDSADREDVRITFNLEH